MSGERLSVWDDDGTKEALKDGRKLDDISVLNCPRCGKISYYNDGSSFYCRHCDSEYYVAVEEETYELPEIPDGWLVLDMHLTLADVLDAECDDY